MQYPFRHGKAKQRQQQQIEKNALAYMLIYFTLEQILSFYYGLLFSCVSLKGEDTPHQNGPTVCLLHV
jgi:hypothetical protein